MGINWKLLRNILKKSVHLSVYEKQQFLMYYCGILY